MDHNELDAEKFRKDMAKSDKPKRASGDFRIASEDKALSGIGNLKAGDKVSLNPKSFTDEVGLYQRRQLIKSLAIIASLTLLIGGGVAAAVTLTANDASTTNVEVTGNERPFMELVEGKSTPPTELSVNVGPNALTILSGESKAYAVNFNKLELPATDGAAAASYRAPQLFPQDSCSVIEPHDFSFCAYSNIENKGDGMAVWLVKDGVNSKFFANAKNFQEVTVPNMRAAAVMELGGLTPEPRLALALLHDDNSALVFFMKPDATLDELANFKESIEVVR